VKEERKNIRKRKEKLSFEIWISLYGQPVRGDHRIFFAAYEQPP